MLPLKTPPQWGKTRRALRIGALSGFHSRTLPLRDVGRPKATEPHMGEAKTLRQ